MSVIHHENIDFHGKTVDMGLENPAEANYPEESFSEHLCKPTTERTKFLKEHCRWKHTAAGEFVDPGVKAGIERMRLITESHKATVGQKNVLRRAKMLQHLLENMTILTVEQELIVGYPAENPKWVTMSPELSYGQITDFLRSPYAPEPREEAMEIAQYWKPYSMQSMCEGYFSKEELEVAYNDSLMEGPGFQSGFNSMVPPYSTVLEDGLNQRIALAKAAEEKAQAELRREPWDAARLELLPKIDEWQAMQIADKAVIMWAQRYSRLCKIVADDFTTDAKRKEELYEIADICQRVPAEPCKGLRDAMQAKWFTFLICHCLERYAGGIAHLEDAILYPYYKISVEDKTFQPMTHEDAVELFECERLKVANHGSGKSRHHREIYTGSNDMLILTVGGLNRFGEDNCTGCTNAILEAARNIRTMEPSIVFRWHPKCNLKTKRLVFECIRDGLGFPSIKNQDVGTKQMLWLGQYSKNHNGATPTEALEWCNVLCMSPGLNGRRKTQKTRNEGGSSICTDKFVELTLFDGYDPSYKMSQVGPHTGDARDFTSFLEFWEAFRTHFARVISIAIRSKDVGRFYEGQLLQMPFVSSIDDGCMEYGEDAMVLSEQPNPWHNPISNTVAVNSLIAIKKLIYDDQKYTMDQLIEALKANWEGYEEMHKDFQNAPKFGNDDDYADSIAKCLYEDIISKEMMKITNYSGAPVTPSGQSVSYYMKIGASMGATPDGRYGGDPGADGGICPYMGTDKNGPTAVLKSVSRINTATQKGQLLNQRFQPSVMRSKHGFKIWLEYMNTWCDLGIDHVQFNVVSDVEMKAAQAEPEKHEDLIVRIAGYSARFVDISKYGQDTLIRRTNQDFGVKDLDTIGADL